MTHRTIAIVIGRAGSKGLAHKNARVIAGRSMISHTIACAQQSRLIDRAVVSTDGPAIADAARAMNVDVIDRPACLANDTATVDDAARHAVDACNDAADVVVLLYANVPVRPANLIDRAVATLIDTGADSVQSYTSVGKHHPYWMMQLDVDDNRVTPYVENAVYRRQDLPPLYIPDGGVIAVTRDALFSVRDTSGGGAHPHAFLGGDRRGIVSNGPVVDVDTDIDLAVAEALLAQRGGISVGADATSGVEPACRS